MGGLARSSALRAVCPSRRGLGRRRRPPRVPGHIGLGPKQTGKQPRNRKIDIQRFPVQPVTRAKHFDRGKLIRRRALQPLRQTRREREGAAIDQPDDHPAQPAVISRRGGTRLIVPRNPATFRCGIDLGISQLGHECPSIGPATAPAARQRSAWRDAHRHASRRRSKVSAAGLLVCQTCQIDPGSAQQIVRIGRCHAADVLL